MFDLDLLKVFKEVFQAVLMMIGVMLSVPFVGKTDWLYGKITFKELKTFKLKLLKSIIGLIFLIIWVYMKVSWRIFSL